MDIEIHYRDFSDLCGTDLKRIHVRQDGVYLEEIPESVAHFLSPEEIETLSFKKARDAFSHSDWSKPILLFPMTMKQFNLFTDLVGFAGSIDQKRLSDFIADQDESNKYIQRHAQAMAGDRIDDRIYRGLLIPTIEDRNLDELIAEASEIVNELDGSGDSSAGAVQVGGLALCSDAVCLLERLRLVGSSQAINDFENAMVYLEDAAVQLVFRIFERETKGLPHASKKLEALFRSGRRKDGHDDLGDEMMKILREHIDAQEGDHRRFPTWRMVIKALERDSVLVRTGNSPIYEVLWQDENRSSNDGTIELRGKETLVTFQNVRDRLTLYRSNLKQEYKGKNIFLS
jgi:hypothetical protein